MTDDEKPWQLRNLKATLAKPDDLLYRAAVIMGGGRVAALAECILKKLQVFFVMLPLKIVLGLILIVFVMPLYVYLFKDLILVYEDKLFDLIKAISY